MMWFHLEVTGAFSAEKSHTEEFRKMEK